MNMNRKFYKEIMSFIKNEKALCITTFFLITLLGFIGPFSLFAQAYFINAIDSILNNRVTTNELLWPSIIFFVSLLLPSANLLYNLLNTKLTFQANIHWQSIMNNIISKISFQNYENSETYDQIKQVNDNNLISMVISCLFSVVTVITSTVLYLIILLRISWWFSLAILFLAPFVGYFSSRIAAKQYNKTYKLNPDRRRVYYKSYILRDREFAKELRVNNSAEFMLQDWIESQKDIDQKTLRIKFKYGFISALVGKIDFIVVLINLSLTLFMFLKGKITIGLFISLSNQIFSLNVLRKVQDIFSQISALKATKECYYKLHDYLDDHEQIDFDTNVIPKIEFKGVSFRYPNAKEATLKNISFIINPSETIAIVGENGAGKTTLIKLLLGLYTPNEGEVLINGINTTYLSYAQKSKLFGVAFQDYAKFALSLRENLSFDNSDEKELKYMSCIFGIDEIAAQFDKGFDTILGKTYGESIDVSGGQWQKIAITRAMMNKRRILIFDEPTASLDPISEVNIFREIINVRQQRTTIFITHRLGFTNMVDKILLIKNGSLCEIGDFKSLMAKKGEFYKLYIAQRDLYTKKTEEESYERQYSQN